MPTPTKTKRKSTPKKKAAKKDIADSYNKYKTFGARQYTGMRVGGSHKWYYDKGEWKEAKINPDLWRINYAVTKRRAGKVPKGSGVPVGTGYHWYIVTHQYVHKLNANDYSTALTGLKYKIAHKRAAKNKWSARTTTQRHHLIAFLKEWIHILEHDFIPLGFTYKEKEYKGEAVPLPQTCVDGLCYQYDVAIDDEHIGMIRLLKNGWKMDTKVEQKLVDAIGMSIMEYHSK